MNTREQFGKYLLLKKLTEDPLGETFRAGLLGSGGMERVSLLRVFNGQGLDGPRLWEASKDRQAIQGVLRSPNIGEGIEIGEIQGIPYAAYEYVSGKNMATLLEQAAKKRNFVPTEHALLITERVALALAAASENRLGGQRILHGFLIPQLTMISNEGETRLVGFEMAPGLRGFAANPVIRQHFGRYLSPETLTGAAPDRGDDIYSLGVFLFELLTGRPLPPPGPDGYASVIDQGILAAEQKPIPEELRQLLKKTLVARDQRMNDVVAWHKALNSWMFEGQYNPTTFNLAFFMHNLFRQEIERENQEIEVEKTLPVPIQKPDRAPPPVAAVPPPAAAAAVPAPTAAAQIESEKTENFIPEYARDEPKSKTGLYLGLAALLVLAAAAVVFFMMGGGSSPGDNTVVPPVAASPAMPQGQSKDELSEQIKEIIAKERDEYEAGIREKYDGQIDELKKQLEETNERRRRQELEQQKKKLEQQRQEELELEKKAEAERLAELERQAEIDKAEQEAAAAAAAAAAQEEEDARIAAAAAAAAEPPPPPPPIEPPPPPPPQVRRGDLVEIGPGVTPPVTLRVSPRFPEMARRLRKTGADVTVKALIDENGKVLETKLVGKEVGFGFDKEAELAVKRGSFKPATVDGVAVKVWSKMVVKFQQ